MMIFSVPAALAAIQAGEINVHVASIKYRIPKSTLYDHVRDNSKKKDLLAINCVLTKSEEKIVSTCQILQLMAFPLDWELVSMVVHGSYLAS